MITKKELRKKAKEIRNPLDMEKISEKIVENILKLEIYKKAKHVMLFYPLKHEVNLLGLLKDDKFSLPLPPKKFYLPKVEGENLLVCPYKAGDKLIDSKFKTKEPITNPIDISILDIVFVPALMADKNFNRLGYGGGYYDKFLSNKCLNATKIGALPSILIVDELPCEAFDIKINVITCEEILRTLKMDS